VGGESSSGDDHGRRREDDSESSVSHDIEVNSILDCKKTHGCLRS
jgi:hypothetical protein